MAPETLVPERFGPLQGVRILSTGSLIAQPFAAVLAAQMGAEVIQIEQPGTGDAVWREVGLRLPAKDPSKPAPSTSWVAERRNSFYVTLNMATTEGREIFLKLAGRADIWMESSKPGTCAKWGLSDEVVHAHNPRLVITHVSGYGQTGDPSYLGRASYDMIGQAFGGLMYQTGFPDPEPPVRANPWTADYVTALFCLSSSLAAYIHAKETGEGQSIDLAQFEAIHAILAGTMVEFYQLGTVRERSGNKAPAFQPYDVFKAKDGWVVVAAVGSLFDKVCRLLELDPKDEYWAKARIEINEVHGLEFDAILRGWVEERTKDEVIRLMNAAGIACCSIITAADAANDPHYQARGIHIEWEDEQVGPVKGVGFVPKFSKTPQKIWRGSAAVAADNEKIYGEVLGFSDEQLSRLKFNKVI
jgi:crotonobetainyl-CoA:carnitine CoA-transferase CaiB-like acyl-CoA transferase